MTQASNIASARNLPNFTDPPLSEVILSLQFAALTNLKSVHIGLLWERFRSEYPIVTEQPPLQTVFETFGVPRPAAQMQIETFLTPPLPRYWFEHSGLPDLLQVQQDRIVHNWRQLAESSHSYPRYGAVKARFQKELATIQQWLSDEDVGEIRANQCEVTYINIIAPPDGVVHLNKITPLWKGDFAELPPNDLQSVRLQLASLFSVDEKPAGRVYVHFHPGFRQSDNAPIIRLEITARGRPKGETIADALAFMDVEREQVVQTFAAVTTKEMHKLWGRTDG
jgi:uncharacterized protein (TIGR04255 family)